MLVSFFIGNWQKEKKACFFHNTVDFIAHYLVCSFPTSNELCYDFNHRQKHIDIHTHIASTNTTTNKAFKCNQMEYPVHYFISTL